MSNIMRAHDIWTLLTEREIDAFWNKAAPCPTTGCWNWQREVGKKGYPRYNAPWRLAGKTRVQHAHRLAYLLAHGDFDEALHVCHRCDNPRCVNPGHLFLGTNYDNVLDSCRKGRRAYKLTPEQVAALRAQGADIPRLAREYGIDKSYAYRIRKGTKRRYD
jgi:hypothetical protein